MYSDFEAKYTEYRIDLMTGKARIMITTEGSSYVRIYKLPPRPQP